MKKLLTAITCGVISAAGVLGLAACREEVKTTVTEEEWKTALSYFMIDADVNTGAIGGDYPRVNFRCVWDMDVENFHNLIWSVDYDKKVGYSTPFEFTSTFEQYVWEENGKFYNVTDGAERQEITEKEFSSMLGINVFYAGGAWISQYDFLNKYEQFTYSEETAEYKAVITYTDDYAGGEQSADVTLKFENGKLAYMATTFNEAGTMRTYTFTYTYGITLTVPDEYLNS